VRDGVN
jgi:hypothetical protein